MPEIFHTTCTGFLCPCYESQIAKELAGESEIAGRFAVPTQLVLDVLSNSWLSPVNGVFEVVSQLGVTGGSTSTHIPSEASGAQELVARLLPLGQRPDRFQRHPPSDRLVLS